MEDYEGPLIASFEAPPPSIRVSSFSLSPETANTEKNNRTFYLVSKARRGRSSNHFSPHRYSSLQVPLKRGNKARGTLVV